MNIKELKIDEDFKSLLPALPEDTLLKLEQDILTHGVLSPIITWNGFIIDGHNRYDICVRHGITEVSVKPIAIPTKADAMQWMVDNQFAKRNLSFSEKILLQDKVHAEYEKQAKENLSIGGANKGLVNLPKVEPVHVSEKMAEKVGVSEKTYRNARYIVKNGTPEQVERMDKGGKGNGVSTIFKEIKQKNADSEPKKECSICHRMLPISSFSKRASRESGYRSECKECQRVRNMRDHARSIDKTGKILKAIDQVKDAKVERVQTFEETIETLESIIENFVNAFLIQLGEIVIDSDEKRNTINKLIDGIKPKIAKERIENGTEL